MDRIDEFHLASGVTLSPNRHSNPGTSLRTQIKMAKTKCEIDAFTDLTWPILSQIKFDIPIPISFCFVFLYATWALFQFPSFISFHFLSIKYFVQYVFSFSDSYYFRFSPFLYVILMIIDFYKFQNWKKRVNLFIFSIFIFYICLIFMFYLFAVFVFFWGGEGDAKEVAI